jgi:AraC-like DNA-binding protein
MQLAIYLIGALLTPSDPWPVSRHADKLFTGIRGVIMDRFADPDFGPSEVAAEAGISLRYLQKLSTARNSTCSEFIYSLRLDHAARLLQRRALLNTSELARLPIPGALATILISPENFAAGSVTRQAPPQVTVRALATEQCAPGLLIVRDRLTTSNSRLSKFARSIDPRTFADEAASKSKRRDKCTRSFWSASV